MTVQETVDYIQGMKRTAEKDTDKRAAKCVEAIDSVLQLIHERECLQNRCFVTGRGMLCVFCNMECNALGRNKGE